MLGTHPRQEVSAAGRQQRWPRGDGAGPQPGTRQAPRGAAPGGFPFQWEAHLSSPGPRLVPSAPRVWELPLHARPGNPAGSVSLRTLIRH